MALLQYPINHHLLGVFLASVVTFRLQGDKAHSTILLFTSALQKWRHYHYDSHWLQPAQKIKIPRARDSNKSQEWFRPFFPHLTKWGFFFLVLLLVLWVLLIRPGLGLLWLYQNSSYEEYSYHGHSWVVGPGSNPVATTCRYMAAASTNDTTTTTTTTTTTAAISTISTISTNITTICTISTTTTSLALSCLVPFLGWGYLEAK